MGLRCTLGDSFGPSHLCPDPPHSAGSRPPEDFPGLWMLQSQREAPRPGTEPAPRQTAPRRGPGSRGLGVHACVWVCVDTRPSRPVHAWEKGSGAGSLGSPRMICHCLMRLMSPGGWYAAMLGRSLDADAHGNDGGAWRGGVRLTRQVVSINLWAEPRVRPAGSVLPPPPSALTQERNAAAAERLPRLWRS